MDENDSNALRFQRRELLVGAAYLTLGLSKAHATIIVDHLPWTPNAGNPPMAADPVARNHECFAAYGQRPIESSGRDPGAGN
jgi:hypothetical protein